MYRVIEVAKMLDVSKVTIYKKMRYLKDQIKPFVVKDKNVTYILSEGVELIRETLQTHDVGEKVEPSLKVIELEKELTIMKESLQSNDSKMADLQKEYKNDLEMMCHYLRGIKISKTERLNSLQTAVNYIRNVINDIDEQIELFVELDKQCS